MSTQPKRSLPRSDADHDEYDEDYTTYTKVRRIMQNGRYEDEVEFLRSRNAELEIRIHDLEDDLERILACAIFLSCLDKHELLLSFQNHEMDDITSLKEDVHLYYCQYRDSQLEVMELEEVILRLKETGECNQSIAQTPEDELVSLQRELADLEKYREVANDKQADEEGVVSKATSQKPPDFRLHLQEDDTLMNLQSAKNPSSSNSASVLSYPLDAPTSGWFLEAFHYLNVELGPQYLVLLQKWIDYERKACWLNPHKLAGFSPEKRPSVLLSWMKNRPRPLPKVNKRGFFTPKFAEEVAAWWASLQPQWRSLDKNGLPSPFEKFGDDLSPLDKHGRNAWVALLACIKWWGVGLEYCVADDRGLHLEKWLTIIADMTRMLGQLAAD